MDRKEQLWRVAVLVALLPFLGVAPILLKPVLGGGVAMLLWGWWQQRDLSRCALPYTILGVIAGGVSLYLMPVKGSYFEFYLYTLLTLLSVGMVGQLMDGRVTPLLKGTPFISLLLLIILFQSIPVLLWTLFLLLFYLYLLLYSQIWDRWEAVKQTLLITLLSLPGVVVLFLFFPRIGLQHATFGLKSSNVVTSFGGIIKASTSSVPTSKRPVLEVEFLGQLPGDLYFRGRVYYLYTTGGQWIEGWLGEPPERLMEMKGLTLYRLKLYPTGGRHIYGLDLPIEPPPGGELTPVYTLLNRKLITAPLLLKLNSATEYKLFPVRVPKGALAYPRGENPKSERLVAPLRKIPDIDQRILQLKELFAAQKLTYTLSPPKFRPTGVVDQLLFQYRKGYCLQLATGLALMARIAGIPSRLVVGYLGDPKNIVNNYLVVRERDAHAWVELLSPTRGWVRVDPTQLVAEDLSRQQRQREGRGNLFLSYLRFTIEQWILHYNIFTQNLLIVKLKHDPHFRRLFFGGLGGLVVGALLIWWWFRRPSRRRLPPEERLIRRLVASLEPLYPRAPTETLYHYLSRIPGGERVNRLYHLIRYRGERGLLPELEREVERLERQLKRGGDGKKAG